uniref:Uncharacterized protein n=1 Tax=Solanum tuberosum TaxID=4113 RepID=M1A892_SOLTU
MLPLPLTPLDNCLTVVEVVGVLDGELEENITNLQEGKKVSFLDCIISFRSVVRNPLEEPQGMADLEGHASQHHPSNWVEADDDDDEGDESELCVQSTPPYH